MRITDTSPDLDGVTKVLFTPTPKGRLEDSVDSTMKDFFLLTLAVQPMTVLERVSGNTYVVSGVSYRYPSRKTP